MRIILSIFTLSVLVLLGCSKETVLDIREGMTFNPDTLLLESTMKGWELYTWQSGAEWRFSLLPGTNRIKSSEEILTNPFVVSGREQFKLMIRQLPSGETISWLGTEWITAHVPGVTTMYEMPPLLTQYDIFSFARRNSVEITVVP